MNDKSILLVSPDYEYLKLLSSELSSLCSQVDIVTDLDQAIEKNTENSYSMVISDHFLNNKFKASCLRDALSEKGSKAMFALMSGFPYHLSEGFLEEIDLVFIKPFMIDDMLEEIEYVLSDS